MWDLSQGYPTVSHHANGSFTNPIVQPHYEPYPHLNTVMLIAIVVICTLQLFVLTLIIR